MPFRVVSGVRQEMGVSVKGRFFWEGVPSWLEWHIFNRNIFDTCVEIDNISVLTIYR